MSAKSNQIEFIREKLSENNKSYRKRLEDLKFSRNLSIEKRWTLFDKWEKVLETTGGKSSFNVGKIKSKEERTQNNYRKEFFESKRIILNRLISPVIVETIKQYKNRGGIITKLPPLLEDMSGEGLIQEIIKANHYIGHKVLYSGASMFSIDQTKQLDTEYEFLGKKVKPHAQTDDLTDNQNPHDIAARDFGRVLIGKHL